MTLPVITTSHKRRYPQAPPCDFDVAKENRFLRLHDKRLSDKLRAANLSRSDLLGLKRQGALTGLAQTQCRLEQARSALLKRAQGHATVAEVDRALEQMLAPLQQLDAAMAFHSDAEVKLVKAHQMGEAQYIAFARRVVDDAKLELTRASATLAQTMPKWAQSEAAHACLLDAGHCKLLLRVKSQHLAKSMRVQWLELGGHAFTKLPHFAAGAFGKVALAMRSDGALRALKTLRTLPGKNPDATQMTETTDAQREVGLMQRYYDASVCLHRDPHTQKLMVEMPLALGSLDTLTSRACVPLVRSTGRQLFAHLSTMHADGVIHNDLKPENINVHHDGRVLPADFGLAGFMPRGSAIGTPAYAAPEHCVGHTGPPPGLATDVWAAGLSLATAHLPLKTSPFAITGLKGMQQLHDGFEAWRSGLLRDAENRLVLANGASSNSSFGAYFVQLQQIDAALCDYLLTCVLVPVAQRATAGEAQKFFAKLQPEDAPQEKLLAQQLALLAETPYRRAAQVALRSRFDIEEKAARVASAPGNQSEALST